VLSVLRAEGTAQVLVLWSLARDIRMLAEAAAARTARRPLGPVLSAHRVPRMREEAVGRALGRLSPAFLRRLLQRCLEVDCTIKGQGQGDPWQSLAAVADALARGSMHTSPHTLAVSRGM
jgi:DNA polymerase-3 subunit delta